MPPVPTFAPRAKQVYDIPMTYINLTPDEIVIHAPDGGEIVCPAADDPVEIETEIQVIEITDEDVEIRALVANHGSASAAMQRILATLVDTPRSVVIIGGQELHYIRPWLHREHRARIVTLDWAEDSLVRDKSGKIVAFTHLRTAF